MTAVLLAFHAVGEGPAPLVVPEATFARQVAALRRAGCTALTVSELLRRLWDRRLPPRAVAITFDDGYASVHRRARPILADAGFVATVLPVTARLGRRPGWPGAPEERLLTEDEIADLVAAGWEVGAHTHTHRALPGLEEAAVRDELERPREILARIAGRPPGCFAYPYGAHDPTARRLAARAYEACLTIGAGRVGRGTRPERVPRVDAWYARRPAVLAMLHGPVGGAYLAARAAGRALARWGRGGA
jgi:peptidoglycan/xylan/chitin deacetylase (PgdA/CDA1 family)